MILRAALLVLPLAACLYILAGAVLVGRYAARRPHRATAFPPVSILKPLHGAEPGLFENLASFCAQDYPGRVQLVFGVADPGDPAAAVVEQLRHAFPGAMLDLVVDSRRHGSNPKISNLINMATALRHEIVVLSDSDMRVPVDYLSRVVGELQRPGTGGVTCLYHGVPAAGLWSRLAALGIDTHFLPGVVTGLSLGLARPCFGSTIALGRATFDAIGGADAFADQLADDHAMGEAVRARGLSVSVPAFTVAHLCSEGSLHSLWAHELRWARTIRSIDPAGYAGSGVTHALPLALIAWALGGGLPALGLAGLAVAARIVLCLRLERAFGLPRHPYALVPLRDLLSFGVFVASYLGHDVNWRGHLFQLVADGTLAAERKPPVP
jgi:ceramide glucosyltransferase